MLKQLHGGNTTVAQPLVNNSDWVFQFTRNASCNTLKCKMEKILAKVSALNTNLKLEPTTLSQPFRP